MSTDINSVLSYLARIHCSRRSLRNSWRWCLLHAWFNYWDAHKSRSARLLIVTSVCSAFTVIFITPLFSPPPALHEFICALNKVSHCSLLSSAYHMSCKGGNGGVAVPPYMCAHPEQHATRRFISVSSVRWLSTNGYLHGFFFFFFLRSYFPKKTPRAIHTHWVCFSFVPSQASRRSSARRRSSLHLTAAYFIITGKLSRKLQTELMLPV